MEPQPPDDARPTLSYERTPDYVPVARFAEAAEAAMAAECLGAESLDFELVEDPKLHGLGDRGATLVVAEEDVKRAVKILSATPARKWLVDAPAKVAAAPVLAYQVPRSGRAVTVAFCADGVEAELLCTELNAAGVPAAAVNEHAAAALSGYGLVRVEVQVAEEDRERAAEVLARLPGRHDVEPADEPPDGSADYTTDDSGARVPLTVAAEYATAQEMLEASAALGSARVQTFLPDLVPRRRVDAGDDSADTARPPPRYRVRVLAEDLPRARRVLEQTDEGGDDDEPRCPQCASWRVHRQGGSLFAWVFDLFGRGADGVRTYQCLRCGHHFTWGNPKGTFEVLPVEKEGASGQ
jgi:hypothetical protein